MTFGFDRYVAIDWTGARGTRHRAIQVAEAAAGDEAPRLVRPRHVWARDEVRALVQRIADRNERVLVGIDCSFSLPFADRGSYFCGGPEPADARTLWAEVEALSAGEPDLGAGGFVAARRGQFWCGLADGVQRDFARLRVAERLHRERRMGSPASPYVLLGASQVGKATLSGMRLLAKLRGVPVWPFDPGPDDGPLLVEIYCQTFALDGGFSLRRLPAAGRRDARELGAAGPDARGAADRRLDLRHPLRPSRFLSGTNPL